MTDKPEYNVWDDPGQPYPAVETLDDLGPGEIREGTKIFVRDVCSVLERKNGTWVSADTYLVCPEQDAGADCVRRIWVSPEDQDASLGQMYEHLLSRHAGYNREKAYELLAKVKEVTEDPL